MKKNIQENDNNFRVKPSKSIHTDNKISKRRHYEKILRKWVNLTNGEKNKTF